MTLERVSEVFVVLEDRPGSIGDLCRVLKKKGINILAIGVFFDTARLHVDDTAKALQVLQEYDYQTEEREVLRVTMSNKPGMLSHLTEKLGKAGINIKYLYSTLAPEQSGNIYKEQYSNSQGNLAKEISRTYDLLPSIVMPELIQTNKSVKERYSYDHTFRYLCDNLYFSDKNDLYEQPEWIRNLLEGQWLHITYKSCWLPLQSEHVWKDTLNTHTYYDYNQTNGLINKVREYKQTENDPLNIEKVTKTTYAYEFSQGMAEKHMLSQPAVVEIGNYLEEADYYDYGPGQIPEWSCPTSNGVLELDALTSEEWCQLPDRYHQFEVSFTFNSHESNEGGVGFFFRSCLKNDLGDMYYPPNFTYQDNIYSGYLLFIRTGEHGAGSGVKTGIYLMHNTSDASPGFNPEHNGPPTWMFYAPPFAPFSSTTAFDENTTHTVYIKGEYIYDEYVPIKIYVDGILFYQNDEIFYGYSLGVLAYHSNTEFLQTLEPIVKPSIKLQQHSAEYTEWKPDKYNRWFPYDTYKWKDGSGTFQWAGINDPKNVLVSQRNFNEDGQINKEIDANGVVSEYLFDKKTGKQIGTVNNSQGAFTVNIDTNQYLVDPGDQPFIDEHFAVDTLSLLWRHSQNVSVINGKAVLTNLNGEEFLECRNTLYAFRATDYRLTYHMKVLNGNGGIGLTFLPDDYTLPLVNNNGIPLYNEDGNGTFVENSYYSAMMAFWPIGSPGQTAYESSVWSYNAEWTGNESYAWQDLASIEFLSCDPGYLEQGQEYDIMIEYHDSDIAVDTLFIKIFKNSQYYAGFCAPHNFEGMCSINGPNYLGSTPGELVFFSHNASVEIDDIVAFHDLTPDTTDLYMTKLDTTKVIKDRSYIDDFQDGSITDQNPLGWYRTGNYWTVSDGKLVWTSTSSYFYDCTVNNNLDMINFIAEFDMIVDSAPISGGDWAGFHFRKTDKNHQVATTGSSGYLLVLRRNGIVELAYLDPLTSFAGTYELANRGGNLDYTHHQWHHFRVEGRGSNLKVYIDGILAFNVTNSKFTGVDSYAAFCTYRSISKFDNLRIYPADALCTSFTYDPKLLAINSKIDENGIPTNYTYDNFGRLKEVRNDKSELLKWYDYKYARDLSGTDVYDPTKPNEITTKKYSNDLPSSEYVEKNYFDGLGRNIQNLNVEGNNDIITAINYNPMGRLWKTWKPYISSTTGHQYDANYSSNAKNYYNGTNGRPNCGLYPYSEISYRYALSDEVSEKGEPGNVFKIGSGHTQNFNYGYGKIASSDISLFFKTTMFDENGNGKQIFKDELGNITGEKRFRQTSPGVLEILTTTRYNYDIFSNILKIVHPSTKESLFRYNTLNQLIAKITPDLDGNNNGNPIDESDLNNPDISYKYDKNGNLRLIKDANHTGNANNINVTGTKTSNYSANLPALTLPGDLAMTGNFTPVSGGKVHLRLKINGIVLKDFYLGSQGGNSMNTTLKLPRGIYNYEIVFEGSGSLYYTFTCNGTYSSYEFIYNKYDAFNRMIETGEYKSNSTSNFTQANADDPGFPNDTNPNVKSINKKLVYDVPGSITGQQYLIGRVSEAKSFPLDAASISTYYSYDEQGRVKWLIQSGLGSNKQIKYYYDRQGKVVKKAYIDKTYSTNNLYSFFDYDQPGRLIKVYTDIDSTGATKVKEAEYTYLPHGNIQQLKLGATPAQTVTYTYNERDWLTYLSSAKYIQQLGYNAKEAIASDTDFPQAKEQYNGNVSWLTYRMVGVNFTSGGTTTDQLGWVYNYDGLNRLSQADFGWCYSASWSQSNAFDEPSYTYDANGNMIDVLRKGANGNTMDQLHYNYLNNSNRLWYIHDNIPAGNFSVDIDDQAMGNFDYDGNGNMTRDYGRGISFVLYDLNNLPVREYKTNGTILYYDYDAAGNRVRKSISGTTYYINGADGKTEAVHVSGQIYKPTYNLWGLDNLGQIKRNSSTLTRYYYLKDHLGSNRMTLTTTGSVDSYNDFYPFGMQMEGRNLVTNADARYKFTSKERDDETGYDYFGARYYDARVGRWFVTDPLTDQYPSVSPYTFVADNPLVIIDRDGMKITNTNDSLNKEIQSEMSEEDKKYYKSLENSNEEFNFMDVYNGYQILKIARQYIDKLKYVKGGESLEFGADCSGFVWAILDKLRYKVGSRDNFTTSTINEKMGFLKQLDIILKTPDGMPRSVQSSIWGDVELFEGHMGFYDPCPTELSPNSSGTKFYDNGTLLSSRYHYGKVHYMRNSWAEGLGPVIFRPLK